MRAALFIAVAAALALVAASGRGPADRRHPAHLAVRPGPDARRRPHRLGRGGLPGRLRPDLRHLPRPLPPVPRRGRAAGSGSPAWTACGRASRTTSAASSSVALRACRATASPCCARRFDRGPGTQQREAGRAAASASSARRGELIFELRRGRPRPDRGRAPADRPGRRQPGLRRRQLRPPVAAGHPRPGLRPRWSRSPSPPARGWCSCGSAGPHVGVLRRLAPAPTRWRSTAPPPAPRSTRRPRPAGLAPRTSTCRRTAPRRWSRAGDDQVRERRAELVLGRRAHRAPRGRRAAVPQRRPAGRRPGRGVHGHRRGARSCARTTSRRPESRSLGAAARGGPPALPCAGGGPVPSFDFDGTRVAYALRDCSDNQGLHLTDVAEAPDAVSYTRLPGRAALAPRGQAASPARDPGACAARAAARARRRSVAATSGWPTRTTSRSAPTAAGASA